MLKLRNICKSYKIGKNKKVILDNINVDFKKKELVFILGSSGSGKSTLLNIIAGNLRCDSGSIFIDDIDISKFNDKELDNYRNSMIGNIFQDYNLIEYMSAFDNIMLGYTGIVDKIRIFELLKQLGIYDKKNVTVNKLSGGEKQRVAIARAIINNPQIILADEPTGALDSENGIKIMEILKILSKNKLVIVVSHDNNLANKYADRVINIKDGKVTYIPQIDYEKMDFLKGKKIKKRSILKLAIKNLWLKKRRTLFTAVTMSFGILSMMIVICLANNFNKEINLLEEKIVSVFPISIYNGDFEKTLIDVRKSNSKIIIKDKNSYIHTNEISYKYIDYLNDIDEIKYMSYDYDISMPIITDSYKYIDFSYFEMTPSLDYIYENYNLVSGNMPKNEYEVLLKMDSNNNVDYNILNAFSYDSDIFYDEIIGKKMKIMTNDNYYINTGYGYVINKDNYELYNKSNIEITIVGIIREKEAVVDESGIYYNGQLLDIILNENRDSEVVKMQLENQYSVLNNEMNKSEMLNYLGYYSIPSGISIYVNSLSDKEKVIKYLDEYNENGKKIIYVDMMSDTIDIVKEFVTIISVVLVLFSLVSIIVSSLMIGILTNMRVIERKKEIGIFRSLGARKRDVIKLFNMENMITSVISSLISLLLLIVISNPLNKIIYNITELDSMFNINYMVIIIIIIINIVIIRVSGFIPSKRASKMEIMNCIYGR